MKRPATSPDDDEELSAELDAEDAEEAELDDDDDVLAGLTGFDLLFGVECACVGPADRSGSSSSDWSAW